MKKNVFAFVSASILLFSAALFLNDGWIYPSAALCAFIIITVIRHFRSAVTKLTRWAKENPRKAQVLITVLQVVILFSGLLVGYDLKELGYKISYIPTIVFGTILTFGFLSVRLLSKKNKIAIPVLVDKDRIAYMSIALSAFILMISTGNRIEETFPDSTIATTLRSIDQTMFSESNFSNNEIEATQELNNGQPQAMLINGGSSLLAFASSKVAGEKYNTSTVHSNSVPPAKMKAGRKAARFEKMKKRIMKKIEKLRKAFAGGASAGVIALIILLVIVSCAGICLALSGGGAGTIAAGIIVTGLAIFGIVKLASMKPKVKEPKQGKM